MNLEKRKKSIESQYHTSGKRYRGNMSMTQTSFGMKTGSMAIPDLDYDMEDLKEKHYLIHKDCCSGGGAPKT